MPPLCRRPLMGSASRAKGRKPTRAKQLGVTEDEYARLLKVQGGGCAICGNTPKTRRLHVDHDHKTGAVRGLLCYRCNRNIPTYADAAWLYAAWLYALNPGIWPGMPYLRYTGGVKS